MNGKLITSRLYRVPAFISSVLLFIPPFIVIYNRYLVHEEFNREIMDRTDQLAMWGVGAFVAAYFLLVIARYGIEDIDVGAEFMRALYFPAAFAVFVGVGYFTNIEFEIHGIVTAVMSFIGAFLIAAFALLLFAAVSKIKDYPRRSIGHALKMKKIIVFSIIYGLAMTTIETKASEEMHENINRHYEFDTEAMQYVPRPESEIIESGPMVFSQVKGYSVYVSVLAMLVLSWTLYKSSLAKAEGRRIWAGE